uniref:RNA polymerase II assembly factor Rtp1 C-terminal domain-containing protein n=1 Tax=Graphocephala atropunctata TaxID=36148 RepID=A0A1B6LQH4_9HEMI
MIAKSSILTAIELLSQTGKVHNTDDCDEFILKNSGHFLLFNELQHLQNIYEKTPSSSTSSDWRVVCLGLESLLCLKENLQSQDEEAERLLSVAQQRSVRMLLDKIVSTGLLPNLLPGVLPVTQCVSLNSQASLSEVEKYECLCTMTLALVELYRDDTLHPIVLPQFLSPILCALCQLTMVPLKKSADTYSRLQRERLIFQQHLEYLITRLYQPLLIKELMIIEGNKKCPKWLKRGVGKLLTCQLHKPTGVLAIVQAVRDAANCAAPTSYAHLESIAQVITASPDLQRISLQILEMLDSGDAEMVRVAVLCIKTLHDRDASACHTLLLLPMTRPLTNAPSSEQSLTVCLQRLHKCFAVPASDFWCLPSKLLLAHIHVLFRLYCKVYQSASHVLKLVEDLMWCFLSKCEETLLNGVFRCLIYREQTAYIEMVDELEFVFGDSGGVEVVSSHHNEDSLEEFGDCLMIFLERRDVNGLLGNNLFVSLLEFAAGKKDLNTVDEFERQLVTVKLLAVLSESSSVQKCLTRNPESVVKFLRTMLDDFLANINREVEIISIVLVVLNVVLNDFVYSKNVSWEVFDQLKEPLAQLKSKAENIEMRLLAEEAHEVIMTRGAMKPERTGETSKKEDSVRSDAGKLVEKVSSCDEALRDACDPLLPIRGHAILQLGKLLASGDIQAKAKKDQILCILQENLKQEDSFLYLSAIEGLATMAAEFPDSVILSLTEQFSRSTLAAETRLKVGEALIRVTKFLGELVPVYKTELINAFLCGTRDEDFLVRASSLSNLGELCRVLGFRVGLIVAEVLDCARCVVASDPSVEVRRAAVMLVCLLLKGLQKDALVVLQDVLLELYLVLKHIYSSDRDDVTRLHAQLALEELNSSTLAFLFPRPQLSKRIFVLDPPT